MGVTKIGSNSSTSSTIIANYCLPPIKVSIWWQVFSVFMGPLLHNLGNQHNKWDTYSYFSQYFVSYLLNPFIVRYNSEAPKLNDQILPIACYRNAAGYDTEIRQLIRQVTKLNPFERTNRPWEQPECCSHGRIISFGETQYVDTNH